MNSNRSQLRLIYLAVLVCLTVYFFMGMGRAAFNSSLSSTEFNELINSGSIYTVEIDQNEQTPTGSATLVEKDGTKISSKYYVSDVGELTKLLDEKSISYVMNDVPKTSLVVDVYIPIAIAIVCVVMFVFLFQGRGQNGAGNAMMNFGKSRAQRVLNNKTNFANVAGLNEEKEDLVEIVDFLKNPQKYIALGARIPKGIILEGSPGTGKTLLAKAVAGEAGVPFFSISGSDFVEMFVGVGASRVRDLFKDAKKNAPCIVFIDEIDAVARKRGTGLGGGHDEREQTLNQMLVEMDGFGVNEGIIVIAATNRPDVLDPAILRPGRFDRKIMVGRPDVRGRLEILKVHSKEKPLGSDVDLGRLARTTAGFTGADLENLLNESAILAAKNGKKFISNEDIEASFVKVGIGTEKKSKLISDKEKKITAYHEAGHAILFHVLPNMGPVHTISIIPTGMGAAGYTMPLPSKDEMFMTKSKLLENIVVSLGGRAAEEIEFSDITTGASADIKQATKLAKAMVMQYGMSDKLGMVNYGDEGDEIFLGRDFGQTKSYGEHMATLIDEEVKHIIDESYTKAKNIILEHKDVLDRCSSLLLEKEKIGQEEFEALFV